MGSKKRKVISAILASTVIMSQYSVVTFAEEASTGSTEGAGETRTDYTNGAKEQGESSVVSIVSGENTYFYDSILTAISDAKADDTINVVKDFAIPNDVHISKNLTIDLKENTVTVANNLSFIVKGGCTVTFENGKFKTDVEKYNPFYCYQKSTLIFNGITSTDEGTTERTTQFVLFADSGANADREIVKFIDSNISFNGSVAFFRGKGELYVENSTLTNSSANTIFATITGNAGKSNGEQNTFLSITKDSKILNANNVCIYNPQNGTIEIDSSAIEGAGGIAMHAGKLIVNKSTVSGSGERHSPLTVGSGASSVEGDGCAVLLTSNGTTEWYKGNIQAEFTDSKIISTQSSAVRTAAHIGADSDANKITSITVNSGTFTSAAGVDAIELAEFAKPTSGTTINGGTFSTDPSEIAGVTFGDKKAAKKNSDGAYTVETYYGLNISDADAITVKRGEDVLTAESKLFKGDALTITAAEKPGYTAKIKVNDAEYTEPFTVGEADVTVSVEYVANAIELDITGVSKNAIVKVTRGGEVLENPTPVQTGDVITVTADPDADVTLSEVTVNGEVLSAPETGYTVTGTETGAKITLVAKTVVKQHTVTIPDGVIVTRDGVQLENSANVVKGDKLTISVKELTETQTVKSLKVNDTDLTETKGGDFIVGKDDVKITLSIDDTAIESVKLTKKPTKLEYVEGEKFDLTGAQIKVTLKNGTDKTVDLTNTNATTDFDGKVGTTSVTVTYNGKEVVIGGVSVVAKSVSGIEVKAPAKTTYTVGDKLDLTGGVITVKYNNDTSEAVDITSDMVSGFDSTKTGKQTVTVTYAGKTATFEVTVEAAPVKQYTVTFTDVTVKSGDKELKSGDKVDEKTELTIEAVAKDGYTAKVLVDGKELTGNTVTVTADVKITVEYTEVKTPDSAVIEAVLNVNAPEFADIAYGDKQPDAKSLVITNSGEGAAKDVKVESDSKDFVVAGSGASVEAGKSIDTWTVQPAAGLAKGEHKAVITVTYGTATTTAGVSITVKSGKQAAPAAVAAESTGTTKITLKKIAANANGAEAEYSIDGKTWQDSNEFSGLTKNTKYTFYARYKETDNYDASEAVSAQISTKGNPSTGGGSGSGGSSRPSGSTSTGTSTSTSTSTTTPTINGASKSWNDVASSINAQPAGSIDSIQLNGSNTVPAAVMSAIASKDAVVTFVVDSTYSWTVDGSGLNGAASSVDFSVNKASVVGTDSLRGTAAVGFQVNGNIPSAKLNINLGASKAGEFANVYKRENGKLVFVDTVKIDANGKASGIDVSTKGEYVVMTGKYSDRLGDVSNDGVTNALDASALLKDIVGALAADNKLVGDFNGDGVVNALDASAILKAIVSAK